MATTEGNISSINIRMYRYGTGDFFLLQLKKGDDVNFNLMIDCGCIGGAKAGFDPLVDDLATITNNKIDLLVVTHEHADHINGFEKSKAIFSTIEFERVWFAWTEDIDDPTANDYRQNRSKVGMALSNAVGKLNRLTEKGHYKKLYQDEKDGALMAASKTHFIGALDDLNLLNISKKPAPGEPYPTMVDLLKDYNVIKENTLVEFLEPGDTVIELENAEGIRFHVLGPPRDASYLNRTEKKGENYEKREAPSQVYFAFMSVLTAEDPAEQKSNHPFDDEYELKGSAGDIPVLYASQKWREIEYDWLYSAGSLAMKYESSINNTSLALAIQFENSEKVLLFPGDAEFGNWQSWHDKLTWAVKIGNAIEYKDASYLLDKTVFYKVGHHLSHNGTARGLGIDLINDPELAAMATLDFVKINSGWLSTMPSDLLAAELIKKTAGRFFFLGDWRKILKAIKTDRITIKKAHEQQLEQLNSVFDGKNFLEWEVSG